MQRTLDLSQELASLLGFVARVAVSIRYNLQCLKSSEPVERDRRVVDAFWLADCLHNLDYFQRAVGDCNLINVISACDFHISQFEGYLREADSRDTFSRLPEAGCGGSVRDAIKVFGDIKHKALASLSAELTQ